MVAQCRRFLSAVKISLFGFFSLKICCKFKTKQNKLLAFEPSVTEYWPLSVTCPFTCYSLESLFYRKHLITV